MPNRDYPLSIEPLPAEEGGEYLAIVPDLPGCMSDGPTREMAARNVEHAIAAWIEEAVALGRNIPTPSRSVLSAA
jgi:antitoxin HicB